MSKFRIGPTADAIPFLDTEDTYRLASDTVQKALVELRNTTNIRVSIDTTAAATETLTVDSHTFRKAIGTTAGYIYKMPDATTLNDGREFVIFNKSTQDVVVKDGAGTILFTLIVGDFVRLILADDTTVAGQWIQLISSSTAVGITSYSLGSDTLFSTSSSSDVLITGMVVTPVSGRYACYYSSDIKIISNNRLSQIVFYKGGVEVSRSRRVSQGVSSNFVTSHSMLAEITVNGSESIDVRVNISSGSVDINQRRMILIRLGA